MEFAILGPLRARRDEHDLPLGGPKQRALLAMLLLCANEVISRERLIEGMWGEEPPPTAEHTLDNYVSRLRRVLGDGRVERRSPGYALRVDPGSSTWSGSNDSSNGGAASVHRIAHARLPQR